MHPFVLSFFSLCCFLAVFSFFQTKHQEIEERQDLIERKEAIACFLHEKEKKNQQILSQIQAFHPAAFLEKTSSLLFLSKERQRVETLLSHGYKTPSLLQRLKFIKSGKNRLLFLEEKREKGSLFQEVTLRLQHPVEIERDDLIAILQLFETKETPLPLFFTSWKLQKIQSPSGEELYNLSFSFLQREPL